MVNGKTSSNCKHSMVGEVVFHPNLPNSTLPCQQWQSLYMIPPRSGANFPTLTSQVFPTTFQSTKSLALNSLLLTSLLYLWASFCWYSASLMVTNSRCSSNKSNCLTINSAFLAGENPKTQTLHKFISVGMTASAPYVRENGVSPVDLLGVVRYAHKTLGNSLAHLPLAPFNLFFNSFTMALLVASTWPLLCRYAKVEYPFLMPRLLQNSQKALLLNYSPLSDTRDFGTLNLVTVFLHTNFLTSTSQIFANAFTSAHLVK